MVLQNLRPGLVNKFGLDDSLIHESKCLIYCNLGAFGGVGPLGQKPGYDTLMQAFAGIMSVTGEDGRPPIRVGPPIVDMGAGLWSTVGILAALQSRTRTGRGCVVDTSLYEAALSWMTVPSALALASGKDPHRTGSEAAVLVPYRAFQTEDKYIVIAVGNDNLFRRFAAAVGAPNGPRIRNFKPTRSAFEIASSSTALSLTSSRASYATYGWSALIEQGCVRPHSVHDGGDEASAN